MKQLNDETVCKAVHPNDFTTDEKRKGMESLIFLLKKIDRSIKGRMCANLSTQRSCNLKEESLIPTVTTESVLITSVTYAKQERDTITIGIPNVLTQYEVPKGDERIMMKIRRALSDMLVEIGTCMQRLRNRGRQQ